jgi:hypothetical protein
MTRRLDVQKRRQWERRLERHRAGELTVGRFCADERVSVNTFYYWAKRLGAASRKPRTAPAEKASDGRRPPARQAAVPDLAVAASAAVVRFRLNAAVEVSVPANCLEVIRCLADCVQHSQTERGAAFHELVVAPR